MNRHIFSGWVGLLLLSLAGSEREAPSEEAASGGKAEGGKSWPHPTEEQWMVASVAGRIGGALGLDTVEVIREEAGGYGLRAKAGGDAVAFRPEPFLLSVESWRPFAEACVTLAPPAEASADDGSDAALVTELLSPDGSIMMRINGEIANRLKNQPGDAAAHEDAALLLGVFGLKEASGYLHDSREVLCRLAAHLALATALRNEGQAPGGSGLVAEALLDVLSGRSVAALDRLPGLGAGGIAPETAEAWRRVIRLRAKGDWAAIEAPESLTLLEQLEYFLAIRRRAGSERATGFFSRLEEPAPVADWGRRLLDDGFGLGFSVQEGHWLMRFGMFTEIQEAAQFAGLEADLEKGFEKAANAVFDAVAAKHEAPDDGAPLPPAMVSRHTQRHLLNHAVEMLEFLEKSFGDPKSHRGFRESTRPLYAKLPLFPLMATEWAAESTDKPALRREGVKISDTHPEWVPPMVWEDYLKIPRSGRWFSPAMPAGMVYDLMHRGRLKEIRGSWEESIQAYAKLAPHGVMIQCELAENWPGGASPEKVREIYGDQLESDAKGLQWLAKKLPEDDFEEILKVRRMAARVDPGEWSWVGRHLAIAGRHDEALDAYRSAYRERLDNVLTSNIMGWAMVGLVERGRIDEAREIADFGAEVYSAAGLGTAMRFHLTQKELAKSADMAIAIHERYGQRFGIAWLYDRAPEAFDGKPGKWAEIRDIHLGEVYPDGRKEIDRTKLADGQAPVKGVRAPDTFDARLAGLRPATDIIVAANGTEVTSESQFIDACHRVLSTRQTLTVYRDGKYQEITVSLPTRSFSKDVTPLVAR
jgi:tetratricopeptide (TPR) repeat protein